VGAVSSTLLGISHDKRVGAGGDSQGTGLAGEILGHHTIRTAVQIQSLQTQSLDGAQLGCSGNQVPQ